MVSRELYDSEHEKHRKLNLGATRIQHLTAWEYVISSRLAVETVEKNSGTEVSSSML